MPLQLSWRMFPPSAVDTRSCCEGVGDSEVGDEGGVKNSAELSESSELFEEVLE